MHAPLGISGRHIVYRSVEPMEEGYALVLLPALQKAMYSTSFGGHSYRTLKCPKKLDK